LTMKKFGGILTFHPNNTQMSQWRNAF